MTASLSNQLSQAYLMKSKYISSVVCHLIMFLLSSLPLVSVPAAKRPVLNIPNLSEDLNDGGDRQERWWYCAIYEIGMRVSEFWKKFHSTTCRFQRRFLIMIFSRPFRKIEMMVFALSCFLSTTTGKCIVEWTLLWFEHNCDPLNRDCSKKMMDKMCWEQAC